jgi:hypothetical protein
MLVYLRTPRVATPAPDPEHPQQQFPRHRPADNHQPVQTLWASRPLQVRAGRLIAVRLRGDDLQVAVATINGRKWVRADAALTAAQAERWVRTSRFARHI